MTEQWLAYHEQLLNESQQMMGTLLEGILEGEPPQVPDCLSPRDAVVTVLYNPTPYQREKYVEVD